MKRPDVMSPQRPVIEAGPRGVHRTDPAPLPPPEGPAALRTDSSATASTRAAVVGVLGAVAAVLAVVVVVQNSESVDVEMLGWTFDAPLAVLLVGALVVGGLLGWVVTVVSRHRRRVARRGSRRVS